MVQHFDVGNCPFCNIHSHLKQTERKIIYEDNHVVVFPALRPYASPHYLCIPRDHIPDEKALQAKDVELLLHMNRVGCKILGDVSPEQEHRIGFHPSIFTSVGHLHLHLIGLPFHRMLNGLRFSRTLGTYIPIAHVLTKLTRLNQ
eukprot:TRINITY_DN6154_c0_g1_i3.p1 TRINITY_DN6154_c0_g1~~TRINITY_DN6154_c0_g1_i3.p1  ORF type:complete len:145 (-),score=26.25 TRINITY_DN6154_c0_g1_i3:357-791(-)